MGLFKAIAERGLKKDPVVVEKTGGITPEYIDLARKAGFSGVSLLISNSEMEKRSTAFKTFLSENGITVYPELAVNRYMKAITPENYSWHWKNVHSYDKPIPDAVLMVMAKIRETFPQASFEVTDIYILPKGDPFLRVSIDNYNWFIIERWSEPKFRM